MGGGAWAEPLDSYLGADKDALMAKYLPAYREANMVNGKVISLPYFADAQFLYYRKDLLEKNGVRRRRPGPRSRPRAQKVGDGESNATCAASRPPARRSRAPSAPSSCRFGAPAAPHRNAGKLALNADAAKKPFELWADFKQANVLPPNIAEIPTDRIRQDFQAGNLIFAMNWGYVWHRTQGDADSQMKGKVGVVPLPGSADKARPASAAGSSRCRRSRRTRPRR